MKRFTKIILSIFSIGMVLGLSSCSGSKYNDGGICGKATVDGTNTYSNIRRAIIEQYVYELNSPNEEDKTKEKYEIYQDKFTLNETETSLIKVVEGEEGYNQAHYLFVYYDNEQTEGFYSNNYHLLVTNYLNTNYSAEKVSVYLDLIDTCANDTTSGYFVKCKDMSKDGDSDKNSSDVSLASIESRMQQHSKACIVFHDGFEDPSTGVLIKKTTWKDAWDAGLLTGLFVYPMAWLINLFVTWFGETGTAQVFAIFIVTALLKLLVLALTFKSSASTQKMQDVQPEIARIQAKYGQNPTPEQKNKMGMELMAVYKKYNIKPFAPFISLLVTFPIFIAMYRAVMYLGVLRTGNFLGIIMGNNLSTYIIGNFNVAALIIFLLMAASQILTMKLPQILNRKQMTREAKKQQSSMNMMSNFMLIMILVMGFMMPVTMSIYWIASALVSTLQSIIMHKLNNGSKNGRYKVKKQDDKPIDIPQGYKTK